ncbi:MAG: NCS1 family nucleobase:cation symporter-1 [Elusimicrobiota bacterium]|nr:NCS1 family nucleobase:cation symporter-1 [Elusimicrobiota bacterium]
MNWATTIILEKIMSEIKIVDGIHELTADLSESKFWNKDISPIKISDRKWKTWDITALWIGMSVCIPTYMLASSLIAGGMNWWQAILTIFLGNCIVLIPMVLNAHAGTKYGIPFPVFARASFGIIGSNIPAILRAIVACGWFGIQTWIGGWAIYKLLTVYWTTWDLFPTIGFLGINFPQLVCFLFFWLINMYIIYRGMESIRFVEDYAAPLLIVVGLALLVWAYTKVGSFGPMLSQPSQFIKGGIKEGQFWIFFFPALTGMVGYWATLSLNIPDFTRYAKSQKAQILGQVLGLPPSMVLFSFIGVAVTSATVIIFGETIWDPVILLSKFKNPVINICSQIALLLATLTTNLAANVVSPANDFSNLWPRKISFRTGGFITGILGILMMPWKLVADPTGYIFTWLIGYSALLGPIGGIIICDYFVIRKTELNLKHLYLAEGSYNYKNGFSVKAIIALLVGILPNIPGFLGTVGVLNVGNFWLNLYHYAWFVGFFVAFMVYLILMKTKKNRESNAKLKTQNNRETV